MFPLSADKNCFSLVENFSLIQLIYLITFGLKFFQVLQNFLQEKVAISEDFKWHVELKNKKFFYRDGIRKLMERF